MLSNKFLAVSAVALFAVPFAANAQQATIVTQGAILSGPGTSYEVVHNIQPQTSVMVDGCLASHDWCRVDYDGNSGWVAADDLQVVNAGAPVVLSQAPATTTKTVTYENNPKHTTRNTATGGLAGAAAGAVIAGPVGAAVGGVIGAVSGSAAEPPTKVTTYVTQHPVQPVQMQQQVQVGMAVPDTVTLTPVPESSYSYVYVNGNPVLVKTSNRQVVRVMN